MTRTRAKWWSMVDASVAEVLLAVDHYNGSLRGRSFEGFVVHMHIAWTYLLHAEFQRSGIDYRYWNGPHTRLLRVDGEPMTWDLSEGSRNRWPANDPVRANIEFFIGLRNKIEHRYDEALALATGGHCQAHILNYEEELVLQFGEDESVASDLRFPVFLQSFTAEGAQAMREIQQRLPTRTTGFMTSFHAALDDAIRDDQRFEFKLRLVPFLGPKSESDMAIEFVSLDDLTPDERQTLMSLGRTGHVIVRERQRDVLHHGGLRHGDVLREVQKEIPFKINTWHITHAWRHFAVRPLGGSKHPERTDERYCVYDEVHRDYVYKQAFAQKLIRHLQTREGFREIYDRDPTPK